MCTLCSLYNSNKARQDANKRFFGQVLIPIPIDHPEIPLLLRLALGVPTAEKIRETLALYRLNGWFFLGVERADRLVGLMGINRFDDKDGGPKIIIKHIAVLEEYSRKGMGSTMIRELQASYSHHQLYAETDDEAIGFYMKMGFCCKRIDSIHGNRYACVFIPPS